MSERIDDMLGEVVSIVSRDRDYEAALKICNHIIDDYPSIPHGLRQRAWVFSHAGKLAEALTDISRVIEMDGTDPHDYALRGRWYLAMHNFEAAIEDQTRVIELGEASQFFYHTESAFFFRAAAFVGFGEFQMAISDLSNVRDDFLLYEIGIGQLSKRELLKNSCFGLGE